MPIGVKALGVFPKKSEKRNLGDIDVDVHFHGVRFRAGEFLYADHDGIIVSATALNIE
jgi:regulator of ribonuclease activity A